MRPRDPRLDETLATLASIERLRREFTFARNHTVLLALERGATSREVAKVIGVAHGTVQNLAARHHHWPAMGAYSQADNTSL